MWSISCLLLLTLGLAQGRVRLDPLVDTEQGLIKGLKADDGDYSMFLGIPFGVVDEDNPFGASSPHPKFDQVFEAYDDSVVCPQLEEFNNTIVGSLDCLHLNVFVPNKASSKNKLPVLVWIYGGGFRIGFGNRYLYGPKYLVQHDVLVVSINYRLGPYGFMCLNRPDIPGNQGLKDQLLALRWIKNNIAAFGGDANKITLMGESAGASSVEFHMISQQEKLFNQVIMQSGSVFGPWVIDESDLSKPLKIAAQLGFQTDDLSEALDFLKNVDTKLVIAATIELNIQFKVCVEQEFEGVESILPDHPINVNYAKVKNTPILSGFNSRESMMTFLFTKADDYKDLKVFDNLELVFDYDENFQDMEDIVRHFYIGDEEIHEDLLWNITDYQSDYYFNHPVQHSLTKFLENGAENVYQYVFSYSGGRNFVKKRMNVLDIEGAAHADEIGYLFDLSYDRAQPSEEDQRMIDQITTLWTNFVKYGEPTPEVTELLPVKWIPATRDTYNYLDIDAELNMRRRPFSYRMALWQLFYKANENKLKGKRLD